MIISTIDQINQIWDESKSILLDDGTQYILSLGIRVYEKRFHSLFWTVRKLLCEAIKCFTSRLYYLGSRTYVATRISTAFISIPTHPFNVLWTNKTSSVSGKYSKMNLTLIGQFRNAVSTRLSATGKHVITEVTRSRVRETAFIKLHTPKVLNGVLTWRH